MSKKTFKWRVVNLVSSRDEYVLRLLLVYKCSRQTMSQENSIQVLVNHNILCHNYELWIKLLSLDKDEMGYRCERFHKHGYVNAYGFYPRARSLCSKRFHCFHYAIWQRAKVPRSFPSTVCSDSPLLLFIICAAVCCCHT